MDECPRNFFQEMMEGLKEKMESKEENTIFGHYGITEKEYCEMIGKFIGIIMAGSSKSELIDKAFPKLDAKSRLKVYALTRAMDIVETYNQSK